MSFADERQAIEARLAANFDALPVKYENQRFEMPPSGGFAAVKIRPGGGRQVSTGSRPLHRYIGDIVIDVFMPENMGTASPRTYADAIEAIFRRAQFSAGNSGTITCKTPAITDVDAADGWFQMSVTIPYQRDRIF